MGYADLPYLCTRAAKAAQASTISLRRLIAWRAGPRAGRVHRRRQRLTRQRRLCLDRDSDRQGQYYRQNEQPKGVGPSGGAACGRTHRSFGLSIRFRIGRVGLLGARGLERLDDLAVAAELGP